MASIQTFAYHGPADPDVSWLYNLLHTPPRLLAVDVETVSLKDRTIIGIGYGLSPTEACYIPRHSEAFLEAVLMLCDSSITKVFHNVMFDIPILLQLCPEIDTTNILDTMLMCNMEGLPQELASIAGHLGMDIDSISDILPKGRTMDQLEDDVVARKCMDDVMATMLVYEKLWPYMNQDYFAKEMSLIPVLTAMSQRGLAIDQERRQVLETKLAADVEFYRGLADGEGFNPASTQQVAYILMQRGCKVPITRNKKGKNGYSASTDEEVLKKIDDPMAALVLNYRKVSKLLSTYILPYKNQERAYTRFHLNAATGRISSTERNMQNIPPGPGDDVSPGPRTMFLPDSGVWTDFDFSQQELRTLAYVSQDPEMLMIYEKGLDIHQEVADFIGIPRKVCKNVNFAAIYGASDETIMETAGITSLKKAHEVGVMWRTKFNKAAEWMELTQEAGLADGYVSTIQGRRLWLPNEFQEREQERRRKAVNYVIQGSAAEITKDALMLCAKVGLDLTLQVHDELLIDSYISTEEIKSLGVENVGPFYCPVEVRYYSRWE
jgi:DNA polymerase-1